VAARRQSASPARSGRPTKFTPGIGRILTRLVADGLTLDEAAKEIGVHPATLYRWQNRYPDLEDGLRRAALQRDRLRYMLRWGPRPRVPWRRDCPECGWAVVVRTAGGMGGFRFWVCERWPNCSFASWRPPAPWSCPLCGEATFWSHSRKSVSCETYWCHFRQIVLRG
jgi:hypothetical protein